MVRITAAIALIIGLAACQSDPPATTAVVSTQNTNDTRIAKRLFGAAAAGSAQASEPFGGYARGCQAGAVELPENGPTWQAMRLSRHRRWGHPDLIKTVAKLSVDAKKVGWNGLLVGDISQARGGPMLALRDMSACWVIGATSGLLLLPLVLPSPSKSAIPIGALAIKLGIIVCFLIDCSIGRSKNVQLL